VIRAIVAGCEFDEEEGRGTEIWIWIFGLCAMEAWRETFSSEGALDCFGGSLISALLLHSESSGEMRRFMSWR
jgi:hypothetical protein